MVGSERTLGFGAELTMALSWPSVMESRPTCWEGRGSTCLAAKKEESWGNTMVGHRWLQPGCGWDRLVSARVVRDASWAALASRRVGVRRACGAAKMDGAKRGLLA